MKETFLTLDPKAEIFEELKTQQLKWWKLLSKDNELYIEIRKDNYIRESCLQTPWEFHLRYL